MKMLMTVVHIEQANKMINNSLVEIICKFDVENIRAVLLKGQGNAQMYINPLRRQCGDIDLYVGRHNYQRVCNLIHQWGLSTNEDDESESEKHLHFMWDKVTIEIHRVVALFPQWIYNTRYQRWSVKMIRETRTSFNPDGSETNVLIPPPNFNAVFLFFHLFHHFMNGGIGLRHLCDWARFLCTENDNIDKTQLRTRLLRLGLLGPWRVFGYILVHSLGMPKDDFPFYSSQVGEKAEKVLHMIDKEGNFGFYDETVGPRPEGYVTGKLFSFRNHTRRLWSLIGIFPSIALTYYLSGVSHGIVAFFADLIKKKK